jgi:hypothetical protein
MVPDVSKERNALILKSQEVHESQKTENLYEIAVRTSSLASDNASFWIKLLLIPDKSRPNGCWRLGRKNVDFLIVVKWIYSLKYQQCSVYIMMCSVLCGNSAYNETCSEGPVANDYLGKFLGFVCAS